MSGIISSYVIFGFLSKFALFNNLIFHLWVDIDMEFG